jgi:hypothetical protein
MLRCPPGTPKYEEYASAVVDALQSLRHFSTSDPAHDALPLCIVLNSRIENTLFEGLSEICERILPQCNQMLCSCELTSNLHVWRDIGQSKTNLTLKLLSFGALETCLDMALNTSHSTRVTESANDLIHNFIYFPDGISRFFAFLEKESKVLATFAPQVCTNQLPISCQFERSIRLVDIVMNLYNSSHALESIIRHVRDKLQPGRKMALFQSLLAAAAAMFTHEHHAVSRKVKQLCIQSFEYRSFHTF